jgi:agmatinase
MHTCPWFHATNIPNCPPANLVQLGIGGWQCPRPGVKVGRERGTTILTVNDIEKIGIDKTIEIALEVAWRGASAVYLSLDIDSVDAGFVPGTGWPEPGGFLPREALKLIEGVAKEGIVAMEVVEVSPPYDISDITSLLAARAMVDVMAAMARHGRIGGRLETLVGARGGDGFHPRN